MVEVVKEYSEVLDQEFITDAAIVNDSKEMMTSVDENPSPGEGQHQEEGTILMMTRPPPPLRRNHLNRERKGRRGK